MLSGANLLGADLRGAQLIETDLCDATLTGSSVFGVAVWKIVVNDGTKQQNLLITPDDEPEITVDNIKVAQFIHLLLNNEEIRDVIDTITDGGKDSGLCRIRHKPDHVGLRGMSDQFSKRR
jgi:uncharacterized protein YjbI with pentapeptide repeats